MIGAIRIWKYELFFKSNKGYKVVLKNKTDTEIKWLSFPSGKYFLLQGYILGSLKYTEYIYEVEETDNIGEYFFKIISKNKGSKFSRKGLEILSCKLYCEQLLLLDFLKYLEASGMDKNRPTS